VQSPVFPEDRIRYCVLCGSPLSDGHCPNEGCKGADTASSEEAPAGKGTPRIVVRRVAYAAVVVLLLAAVVSAALVAAALDTSVDELRRGNAALRRSLDRQQREARERADGLERTVSDQTVRLGSIEAKLNAQRDPADVAASVRPSVFTISTRDGLGSGFVVSSTNDTSSIITNFHVVARQWLEGRKDVLLKRDDVTYHGTVQRVSEADDLALISVAGSLPALSVARRDTKVGETVLVVGSPLGLGGSVASGIVSAVRTTDGVDYLQFSAPISPGNSGGPVVDRDGNVIGVAVAKLVARGAEGLSLAVPVAKVCQHFGVC
jgi:putative serine protease PepD